jgi:hypothetical protein
LAAYGPQVASQYEIGLLAAHNSVNVGVEEIALREGKIYVFQLAAMDDVHALDGSTV